MDDSRRFFVILIHWFYDNSASAIILGCTKISMLITEDVDCLVVDCL